MPLIRRHARTMPTPTLDARGRPVAWRPSTVDTSLWGRPRVLIANTDVTFFRNVPVQIDSWSSSEPFDDASAVLSFPQISPFDTLGPGNAVPWLYAGAPIEIRVLRPDASEAILWQGLVMSLDDECPASDPSLKVGAIGFLHSLDLYLHPPPFNVDITDIGTIIYREIAERHDHYNYLGGAPLGPVVTGVQVVPTGSFSETLLAYFQSLLAAAGAGNHVATIAPGQTAYRIGVVPGASGYWIATSDGDVVAFANSTPYFGSMLNQPHSPIVDIGVRPQGDGYWLLGNDGGIFALGAPFYGNGVGLSVNPFVGMDVTPTGLGYWLVTETGGVFAFGDAGFFGSSPTLSGGEVIIDISRTPSSLGYVLVSTAGHVFAYGDASYLGGATGGATPAIAYHPSSTGYWIVHTDGGVYAFGASTYYGGANALPGGRTLAAPINDIVSTPSGNGYWLLGLDGGVFAYGDAGYFGSIPGGDGRNGPFFAPGAAWTLMLNGTSAEVRLKDKTTVHATLYCGDAGVTHSLTLDYTSGTNVIYGEGTDEPSGPHNSSCSWRNTKFPAASQDTAPVFDGNPINPGDTSAQWGLFATKGIQSGWGLNADNYYAPGEVAVVKAFQTTAGITADGIVGAQAWAAMFQPGTNSADLSGSYFAPLAIRPEVEPYTYTANGAVTGSNPAHDPTVPRVERFTNYGDHISKADATSSAVVEIGREYQPGWAGTITLTNVSPVERSLFELKAGMNVSFKHHRGADRLMHVAGVEVSNPFADNGTVTLHVDEKGRDLMTLAAIRSRDRAISDLARQRKTPRGKKSITADVQHLFDCEAGAGRVPRHATQAGRWNVLQIPVAESGSISRAYFKTDSPVRFAVAVFTTPIAANDLANIAGNPLAFDWSTFPTTPDYGYVTSWGGVTAGVAQSGGFSPGLESNGDPLTGVLEDDGSWPYTTIIVPWLFVAVWTESNNYIAGELDPAPVAG